MKFTFSNNILAAAFCAAVQANHEDICGDDLDTCAIGNAKGRVSIEINDDGFMQDTNQHDRTVISTLAQLEQAIGDSLAIKVVQEDKQYSGFNRVALNAGADSPLPNRNIVINKLDGYVTVGCKTFPFAAIPKVVEAARQVAAGKKIKKFSVGSGDYRHTVERWENKGYKGHLLFDGDSNQRADEIVKLGAILDKIIQRKADKAKPAPKAQPFRIFPPTKTKAKKK